MRPSPDCRLMLRADDPEAPMSIWRRTKSVTRRSFLNTSPAMLAPLFWESHARQGSRADGRSVATSGPGASFPTQPPELVREMVGAAHGNLARVNELLARQPTLARAAYDWGFGDWEDALGAASHVGNREIAGVLLRHGARPSIFSAAMLGQLDVVKAFVDASPGIESTPGPHGITLMRHALAGGPPAQRVVEYLKTLPGADARPESVSITAGQMSDLVGDYVYGAAADERITIAVSKNGVTFTRRGASARNLVHVGDRAFFPVGAPNVRIAFRQSPAGMRLTIHDGELVLEATRAM
jgi:hypothetical protein